MFYRPIDPAQSVTRMLGSLLSAHMIITDPVQSLGNMSVTDYGGELLDLAHDLASRLLPAFSNTGTGIPYPRVCAWIFIYTTFA